MQKKKYRKVNFRINHCSSQDHQYPVTQLLLQSPDAKGWQNARFSTYPQIIIIELVQPTLLRQVIQYLKYLKLTFLSHQSKIATKIQIQAKLDQNKDWKKLGYVSLSSNQNTNFQARQLRTANLNGVPAYLIKLIFKQNHINGQNIFNQVGLISFSVYGDKMVQSNFTTTSTSPSNQPIGSTLQFDKQTLQKLKQLQIRKKQAVDSQQFDLAQNLKQQIDRIKSIGQTLILLQQKKQQAIKKQDYQAAKIINDQMKKMRDQNHWGPNMSSKPSGNPAQFLKKQKTQHNYQQQEPEHDSVSPMSNNNNKNNNNKPGSSFNSSKQQQQPMSKQQKPALNQAKYQSQSQKQQSMQQDQRPLNIGKNNPNSNNNSNPNPNPKNYSNNNNKTLGMDQRPLDNKNTTKMPNQYAQQQQQGERQGGQLQPLSKQILQECQQFFNIVDQQIFQNLYSKDHRNRQNGMRMVRQKLNERINNKQAFIEAMLFCIKCTIDDRIASVLITTLEVFDQFMKKIKPSANVNYLPQAEYILEKIADYLGHTNQKIVNISESVYSNLPVYQLTNKNVCYKCLTMTYKREKPPKILTGKLKMIAKIVNEYQLGKSYDETISYIVKYVDDKNNDVRNSAINAICAISNEIGYNTVKPFLNGVRPQIIKAIQEQLQASGQQGNNQKDFDDRPIKANNNKNVGSKNSGNQRNQIQTVENQFIDVPKNKGAQQDNISCPFCKKTDERFVEQDYLDMHFFHSCPMLTVCLQCKQTIQINYLTAHLVGQCANSKYFKKCPRCKQAVHQKIYKTHVQKKQCLSAKPLAVANRCPLCHLDIASGANGWVEHLVEEGCQNNPRK